MRGWWVFSFAAVFKSWRQMFIDDDAMSIEYLREKIVELGYMNQFTLWYCIPGRGLSQGLLPLTLEDNLKLMLQYARKEREIEIFSNHGVDIDELVDMAELVADEDDVETTNAQDEIDPIQENQPMQENETIQK
ncbi:uncharacterized protein A4U43_C06F15650 [Asparagus officinalis]|uniref:Uncharacterized protein n=1 Tax=Asparagus officinalis TaxID=4686 RepID=A0A5P1EME7_ASPOF|nr:uncharacterized protein A4U43_C06F15650 [Asparagus officinalis]